MSSTPEDGNSDLENPSFSNLNLDNRILRALSKQGLSEPTPIQASAIPLALEGKDLLARARTGSGKTLTYLIPLLQLGLMEMDLNTLNLSGLILVPTKELAEQVIQQWRLLTIYCNKINAINVAGDVSEKLISSQLKDQPYLIIGTPSRVLKLLENKILNLKDSLKQLIIDEADLVLSFGYESDLKKVLNFLPKIYQSFLLSATINKDIENLKKLILRNPAILKLKEDESKDGKLIEYCINCKTKDKYLLLYVIFKLQLIQGKCLIFVNSIEKCYKLKLYLDQFGIKSCVMNSELPLNSRYHIIEEFNKGIYDYIIASDEFKSKSEKDSDDENENEQEEQEQEQEQESKPKLIKKKKVQFESDKEYGVSRGIDFKNVAAVLNFDIPMSAKSYTHRIGRTARGGKSGMALTLVASDILKEQELFSKIEERRLNKGYTIQPYEFNMKQIEGFRYRCEDAERVVTKLRINQARVKELKQELLNSDKLKQHFDERPIDLKAVRHDTRLFEGMNRQHLKNIPIYLKPKVNKVVEEDVDMENLNNGNKDRKSNNKGKISFGNAHKEHHKKAKKRHDPLRSIGAKGNMKKTKK